MREPNNIDPSLCPNLGLVQTGNSEIISIVNNSGNLENNANIGNIETGVKIVNDNTKNHELPTKKDENDDNDYVVDIYLQQAEQPTDLNMNNDNDSNMNKDVMADSQTTHTSVEFRDPGSHIPVVQVDG